MSPCCRWCGIGLKIITKGTWIIEQYDPLVDCILQDILDQGDVLDETVEQVMNDEDVFELKIYRVLAVYHPGGYHAEGYRRFLVSDDGVEVERALAHNLRVVRQLRQSLQGNLRSSPDPVLS